jgi:hypothetical protein
MNFQKLVERYQKRNKSALMDSITAGLSVADEISVDLGLLEAGGVVEDLLDKMSAALPFALVAITEGGKVIFKKKTPQAAMQDAKYRAIKTGVAMGAGAAVVAAGASVVALPVTIGVRYTLDKYRSNALLSRRVQDRIKRVRALKDARNQQNGLKNLPVLLSE